MKEYMVAFDPGKIDIGLPVSNTLMKAHMQSFMNTSGKNMNIGNNITAPGDPMSDELKNDINNIFSKLDCSIRNNKINEMADKSFASYFDGSKSYDDCYNDFVKKIQLYINE